MAVHHVHELEQAPVVVDHLGQNLALVAQDLRSGQGGCLRTRNAKKKETRRQGSKSGQGGCVRTRNAKKKVTPRQGSKSGRVTLCNGRRRNWYIKGSMPGRKKEHDPLGQKPIPARRISATTSGMAHTDSSCPAAFAERDESVVGACFFRTHSAVDQQNKLNQPRMSLTIVPSP